jgi:hypothetical protein
VFIYLDGTVEHSKLKQKSGEHYFCKGNISYAILDEKELRVYDPNLKMRFSHSLKHAANLAPCVAAPLPNTEFYSLYVADEQKAYLFNINGSAVSSFPIKASAPLLVDNLRDSKTLFSVVACDDNGFLSCYNVAP